MDGAESTLVSSSMFDPIMNGHSPQRTEALKNYDRNGAKGVHDEWQHPTKSSIDTLTQMSQYHVEHLSTFVLERKDGMMTVDDGIRRLRLLDAKGKVWTQELVMQVDQRTVSLMDLETRNELENFPVSCIQLCQAVMDGCSYDSILALVCKETGQNKPDLYLFQCDDIKASLIHADIESAINDAKGGKVKKRPETLKTILKSSSTIPPPPADPAPEPPPSSSQLASWSAWTHQQQEYERRRPPWEEEPTEMAADRVDREVQILNRLLDDIEFFISKLQKAAEAESELSSRKRHKKGRKKGAGEGVLTLRSKPPPADQFIDCLQKFKHAFNQLAGLKNHIQNPSAMDLLHFLFAPLRMVIQSSGGVEVARSVIVPLLSRDAVDFLHSAGSAEERHLWVTLGDGWTKSRLEWPRDHYFPPCELKFRDGWEPPSLPAETTANNDGLLLAQDPNNSYPKLCPEQVALQRFPADDAFTSSVLGQDSALAVLKNAISAERCVGEGRVHKMLAKSKYDFVARNNTELSVLRDEVLEVLDSRKQWWKVCNGCGVSGYVPNNILEVSRAVELTSRGEPIYSHTIQLMMPRKEFELFKQLLGELNEKQTTRNAATPPRHTLTPSPPLPPPSLHTSKPSETTETITTSDASEEPRSSEKAGDRRSNMEQVQDELSNRLTLGRSAQKKLPVAAVGGSSLSITYDSPPDDVRAWLEAKGFSAVTISSLGVLTGAQLFSLNKEELKTVCPDDGARVFSQVTVQKAALEKSSGCELQELMRRRQMKLEANANTQEAEP